jgi:hypothetical protein
LRLASRARIGICGALWYRFSPFSGGPRVTGDELSGRASGEIMFYFTDAAGKDLPSGKLQLPPSQQLARFLSEPPFNGPQQFEGTVTFTAGLPVGAVVLQGRTSTRGEYLMTTLPVTEHP